MKIRKSTRYALYAVTEMAAAGGRAVPVAEVAGRYRVPATALAKAFQRLVRVGIAQGTRGVGGGYRLARPPQDLTLLDVLRAFEPRKAPGRCVLLDGLGRTCNGTPHCRLHRLFDEIDDAVTDLFGAVTIASLARPRAFGVGSGSRSGGAPGSGARGGGYRSSASAASRRARASGSSGRRARRRRA